VAESHGRRNSSSATEEQRREGHHLGEEIWAVQLMEHAGRKVAEEK
jgi:predicted transposase YdaD